MRVAGSGPDVVELTFWFGSHAVRQSDNYLDATNGYHVDYYEPSSPMPDRISAKLTDMNTRKVYRCDASRTSSLPAMPTPRIGIPTMAHTPLPT